MEGAFSGDCGRRLRGEIETQLVEEDFLVSELSSILRAGL
jgi:hypothetical protein